MIVVKRLKAHWTTEQTSYDLPVLNGIDPVG